MKRILLTASVVATFVAPFCSFAGPDNSDHGDTVSPRYITFPGLGNRRWENSTIPWWYNPSGQQYETEEAVYAIKLAANAWENVSGVNFEYMGTTDQSLTNQNDDKFVIGWLDNTTFLKRFGSYSAIARIWGNKQYIVDGEISINADRFSTRSLGDFQGLMTHELGHILGLDHPDQEASIMYYPYHTPDYLKTLKLDDIIGANVLYPKQSKSNLIPVNCDVIVADNLDIYLPVFALTGDQSLWWASLEYSGKEDDKDVWTLGDFGYISDIVDDVSRYKFKCNTTVLADDLSVDIPVARYEGTLDGLQYSAKLDYSGIDDSNNHRWILTKLNQLN